MKGLRCVVVLLFLAGVLQAQNQEDPLALYDSQLVKIGYSLFGGLNLSYQGVTSSVYFGINPTIYDVLVADPQVKPFLEDYTTKMVTGNVLIFTGLAAVIGGIYYAYLGPGSTSAADIVSRYSVSLGLLIGGEVLALIGAFLIPSSFESLTSGVNLYNRNRVKNWKN